MTAPEINVQQSRLMTQRRQLLRFKDGCDEIIDHLSREGIIRDV